MKPWTIDADAITLNNIEDDSTTFKHIVLNNSINEYLNIGDRDNKYFIVAPKGYGKTLLLKAKSKKYREKSGYQCIPKNDLCEKMTDCTVDFSSNEIGNYKSMEMWEDIWKLSLHILIIQNYPDLELPPELKIVIGKAKSLSNILTNILYDRKNFYKHKEHLPRELSPDVKEINSQIAIFFDNVDEAFERHTGALYREKKKRGRANNLSPRVWVNAHLGLMAAIKSICTSNKHIKIFTSIRSEAYVVNQASSALQLKSYTTELLYSNQDLLEIFEKNIFLSDSKRFNLPNAPKPLMRFLGLKQLEHRFAKDSFGNPRKEEMFDFILRHTLKRPRELMLMGASLYDIEPHLRKSKLICDTVTNIGKELFDQYKKEMIPFFKEEVYHRVCQLTPSNIIGERSYKQISKKIDEEFDFKDVFDSLYRLGLIGWVEEDRNNSDILKQRFLPAARYNFDNSQKIPDFSKYIVTHPILDKDLWTIHGDFYNKNYIIGYDYPFIESEKLEKHHIHFGLSRDSITLVIPELHKNTNLAIIKKPNEEWAGLFEADKFIIEINDDIVMKLDIFHDRLTAQTKHRLIKKWEGSRNDVLFYTNDRVVIEKLVKKVDNISTCKSDGGYESFNQIINHIDRTKRVNLYAFEYSKQRHKNLQSLLKEKKIDKVTVIPGITECYFYSQKRSINNRIYKLEVDCENYSEFIIYTKNDLVKRIFLPNLKVLWAEDKLFFMYHLKRNKLLSEAIYRFRKLCLHLEENEKKIDKNVFKLFCKMQLFYFRKYFEDTPILSKIHKVISESEINDKLNGYIEKSWERFENLPSRFKKIEDLSKYQEKIKSLRLLPNETFLIQFIQKLNPLEKHTMLRLMEILSIYPSNEINPLFYNKKNIKNKSIFISYSSENTEIADEIDLRFKHSYGIKLTRDIRDLPYKANIKIFMNKVREADFVLILISDTFLKSKYCMYEMIELKKDKAFDKKILPVLVNDSVKINRVEVRHQYYTFWLNEYEKLIQLIESKGASLDLLPEKQELDLVEKIKKSIDEFLVYLSAFKLLHFEELTKKSYLPILNILHSFDEEVEV